MAVMSIDRLEKVSRNIGKFAGGLIDCEKQFEINTPLRAAHFLAQLSVESRDFTKTAENMRYSAAKRIHEVFRKRITKDEAKNLTTVSPHRAATMDKFYQHMNAFFGVKASDTVRLAGEYPAVPRGPEALTRKAYGAVGNEGRGLIQMPLEQRRQVLRYLCEEYRQSTDGTKPRPLKFIETLQGVGAAGAKPKVLALADNCQSIDEFVAAFSELMAGDGYVSAISAGAYWITNPSQAHNLNQLADGGAGESVIKKVSGAVNRGDPSKKAEGLTERIAAFKRIYPILKG